MVGGCISKLIMTIIYNHQVVIIKYIYIYKDTPISGNLDVGEGAATSNIKAFASHNGNTSSCELIAVNRDRGKFRFNTDYGHGTLYAGINNVNFFRLTNWNNEINFYKPTTGTSDDRLKENEEIIENACETLSKLRPQLYDKKPDIDNDDPTTWYKESGLIAQEIYCDAPGLRHLVIEAVLKQTKMTISYHYLKYRHQ